MKRVLCISLVLMILLSFVGCNQKTKLQKAPNGVKISNYKNLEMVKTEYIVSDAFLDDMLNDIASNFATTEKIVEGVVEKNSIINISYDSYVGEILLTDAVADNLTFTLGSKKFCDDFENAIIGKKIGETIQVEITYPMGSTYSILDGKTVTHHITINYMNKIVHPQISDELIQTYVKNSKITAESSCKTVAEYRNYLKNRYEFVYKKISRDDLIDKILTHLLENSEFPPVNTADLEIYVQTKYDYYVKYCKDNGFTIDYYLSSENLTEDEFKTQLRIDGETVLKKTMLINAIKDLENITLSDDYYVKYLKHLATYYQFDSVTELETSIKELDAENTIKGDALYDAVYEYLVTNQNIKTEKVDLHDLVLKGEGENKQ